MDKDLIKSLFYYDSSSPTFIRTNVVILSGANKSILVKAKGEPIGWKGKDGYGYVRANGKLLKIHHVVMTLNDIEIPKGFVVDHIDGNCFNNDVSNLRCVSFSENLRNQKKYDNNTSGATGVWWQKNKQGSTWAVACCHSKNGKRLTKSFSVKKLGLLPAFRDAVLYRDKMIHELNKEGFGYTERHGK